MIKDILLKADEVYLSMDSIDDTIDYCEKVLCEIRSVIDWDDALNYRARCDEHNKRFEQCVDEEYTLIKSYFGDQVIATSSFTDGYNLIDDSDCDFWYMY